MKRAKAWKNKNWPEGEKCIGRPKSYLICILVLSAYQKAEEQHEQGFFTYNTIEKQYVTAYTLFIILYTVV